MKQLLHQVLSVDRWIPEEKRVGPIPATKEIYERAMRIAWPSIVESALVSVISSVDMMMVGVLGTSAIAAVGLTGQPRLILLSVIFSLNAGVTAIIARRKGEEDQQRANAAMRQSILLCLFASLALSVIGFVFAEDIMRMAGAKADLIADATTYFKVICTGLIFNSLSMTINAAQRGVGNSKISMRTNITANLVNVCFNYLLIGGNFGFPRLGVAGAAIATNIGLLIACIMSILSISRDPNSFLYVSKKDHWGFHKDSLESISKVSSSAFLEQMFFRIGFFINARIVVELGTVAFATYQIGMQVINLSFAFGDGLSVAGSALMGQSLGAKRPDLAKIYGKCLQRISFMISSILFIVFIAGRFQIIGLFDQSADVLEVGAQIMLIIAFTTHIQTSQIVISGCLRGAGDTKYVAAVAMLSTALIRPLSTYLLCFTFGFELLGAWFALFFDQCIRLTLNYIRFHKGNWTKIEL